MRKGIEEIKSEVKKAVTGKEDIIEKILNVMLAQGHILLEDVPGVGKTTLALAFSKVLQLGYQRVQFTPDTMPSDIVGFSLYNKKTSRFEFKPGAVFCNLFLGDEINRTSSKTQSALLEVMEEGAVTIDGIRYEMEEPFIVIATQNPIGSAGTQNLPESQLDRFMARISVGYPSVESQVALMRDRQIQNPLDGLKQVVTLGEFKEMREAVQRVIVTDEVLRYIARLCEKTREHELVELGVSPRGGLALFHMAQGYAYLHQREYVIPEDVRAVFFDVCAHRLRLKPQARIEGVTEQDILTKVLKDVEAPSLSQVK